MKNNINNFDLDNINDEIVKKLEKEYPEMTTEFKKILVDEYILFCQKQNNYGKSNISMGTELLTEDDIKLSLTGLVVRLNDKIHRLIHIILKKQMKDVQFESIEDTFKDASIYSVIAQVVVAKKWGK